MELPPGLRQDRIAHRRSGAPSINQQSKENKVAVLRRAIERTIVKFGVVAIATTLLVFPAASTGAETARATEGFSTQTLASDSAVENGGQLVVMRIVLEPGVTLSVHHHPGSASFTVVSGN